ncbi:Hypothetical protein PHPALM_19607 [Phytophthora palmivora]|uniref:Integrase catalytic domain-containing protein n=1 Tax=Phytophthora palmivora TaxID=4796 RepID=A0A2P4XGY2_9STRA|nr:Hypothetical protein PHPALM_19607 [Phytophthora palmivora]
MHFQLHMHECFREMPYDSVDDVLIFSKSAAELLEKLRVFCQTLRRRNLKLNAKKCTLFAPKVIWRGKVIDGEGVPHCASLYIFDLPIGARAGTLGKDLKQHVCEKLQRWALKMVGIRYVIEHIKGEDNLWADMISRWGQPCVGSAGDSVFVKGVTTRSAQPVSTFRPLQDTALEWSSETSIRHEQQRCHGNAPTSADEDGLIRVECAKELLQRIFVVAHCDTQGHRVRQRFGVVQLRPAVDRFVRACILRKRVKGGQLIQRTWGPTATVTHRNQCLHVDYLYLGPSCGDNSTYVLVLKNELTHYCELVPADTPTSSVAAAAVLDWCKRFGLPEEWISDNRSHFKAQVMEELVGRAQATQNFVPVYSRWVNGTVERVKRDLLQVLRVALLELQLDTRNWHYLLPVIQANLNRSSVESLGGHAPVSCLLTYLRRHRNK